jgi:hypothetical protein
MTTNGLSLVIFFVLLAGVWIAATRLEEIVDALKEIKDLLDIILDAIERVGK